MNGLNTRADVIRNMADKELAHYVAMAYIEGVQKGVEEVLKVFDISFDENYRAVSNGDEVEERALKWLQELCE